MGLSEKNVWRQFWDTAWLAALMNSKVASVAAAVAEEVKGCSDSHPRTLHCTLRKVMGFACRRWGVTEVSDQNRSYKILC